MMGEHADWEINRILDGYASVGPYTPGPVRRRPLTHQCPLCPKVCRGFQALYDHGWDKHKVRGLKMDGSHE